MNCYNIEKLFLQNWIHFPVEVLRCRKELTTGPLWPISKFRPDIQLKGLWKTRQTLVMIQTPISMKSIIFWDVTPCSLPEDDTLYNHRYGNLKSYLLVSQ
jgi:hypothetical protein